MTLDLAPDRSLARWLRLMPLAESYRTASLRQEVVAGVTVAALVVPQGMAYALLAGLPPAMGLYAAILPMIVYALAGSGRQTSVGPVTVDSLMLVLGLSTLATAGTGSFIALAVLLTALIGAIQLGMGALRLGFLVNFLSYPVLAGFTSAAAIITVLGQLQHVLGISEPQQPAPFAITTSAPCRVSRRIVASLISGASTCWAQPLSSATRARRCPSGRNTCGAFGKFPWATGGDGASVHSRVVALHGLAPTFSPRFMLQKKLKMKTNWNSARVNADIVITLFHTITPSVKSYMLPPSYMRRDMPRRPWISIGKKIPFIASSDGQKWIFPSRSLYIRPVILGHQW